MKKISTFIFVHDQKIVEDYINHGKFNQLSDVKYVFVGNNDSSNIESNPNVIICNKLSINIENYPKLTSFTGWYALYKNNLYNPLNHLNLLEYDVNITDDFEKNVEENLDYDVIGYIPFNVHDYQFIKDKRWSDVLISSIQKVYGIEVESFINSFEPDKGCSMTSNHTFSGKAFEEYVKWIEPLIDEIKQSPLSGHQIERSISLFYLINNLKSKVCMHKLHHFQFDSHKTQDIPEQKIIDNYSQLL